MTGIERRRRQRGHRLEVAFEALADTLAMPEKNVALALAAAPLQILVERFEARKVRTDSPTLRIHGSARDRV